MPTKNYRRKVDKLLHDYERTQDKVRDSRRALIEAESQLELTEQAQALLQSVAQQVQQNAHNQIAGVVSQCLEAVFENPYAFKIHFERKRGKTEARLAFERGGNEVDPMEGASGGIKDVGALALRLACLVLSKPRLRPLVVLDEPFKGLWRTTRPRVAEMIETLADELGFQFIIVTQIEELEIGKVIRL